MPAEIPEKFTLELDRPDPDLIEIKVKAIKMAQPIGELYLASFPFRKIVQVTYFDVRRTLQEERDIERYLGIQRPLIPKRVDSLQRYVNFKDATYPTAVIVSIDDEYLEFDDKTLTLCLRNYKKAEDEKIPSTNISRIAKVIDGQHRVAGLLGFKGESFDVPVTILPGSDLADQAYVFSTVNLEQTKVGKSLAFDLFDLATSRSPQKTAHNIAVALDREVDGPLYGRIKRLGLASGGETLQTITQATFVESLMRYISDDPKSDRDHILRRRSLVKAGGGDVGRLIFRNMFIDERDDDIGVCLSEYFAAVRERWTEAWNFPGRGRMLNRTNGFRGLMAALRYFYLEVAKPGDVVSRKTFLRLLRDVPLEDDDFTTGNFPPGTAGEARLRRILTGEETLGR